MVGDATSDPLDLPLGHRTAVNARHRASYDLVASDYAARNQEMPEDVVTSAKQFSALIGAGPVLDLGCGHGRDMAWFGQRGISMVGADLSEGMLAQARRRVGDPLVQLDMRHLAFRNARFRGVWSDAAMLHLPKSDLPGILSEVSRVLIPGGVLFSAVQIGEGEGWEAWDCDQSVLRFFVRYSCAEFAGMLASAGFTVQAQSDRRISSRRHWAHFLASRDTRT